MFTCSQSCKLDQAFGEIVGQSDAIKHVHFKINQVAATDLDGFLIMGETGTGKEFGRPSGFMVASKRKGSATDSKVNWRRLLSPSLIESELFGHEKGRVLLALEARKLGPL